MLNMFEYSMIDLSIFIMRVMRTSKHHRNLCECGCIVIEFRIKCFAFFALGSSVMPSSINKYFEPSPNPAFEFETSVCNTFFSLLYVFVVFFTDYIENYSAHEALNV